MTHDDRNVKVRDEFDVFGDVRSETGTSDNVHKFTGKEYDADVKLYDYSALYYHPASAGSSLETWQETESTGTPMSATRLWRSSIRPGRET